jgi:hypothetical protein
MSDESAEAIGGNDAPVVSNTLAADAPAEFTPNQAAKALADLRWKRSQSPAESAEAATAETELSGEDNAAPAAEQAHGEDEGADPANEPPIDRPKSWTEAEDAEWRATPRALQQKIVARELERDNALRRTQNDAAEKLKGLTAKEQEAEKARQQYEAQLPALMQTLQDAQQASFGDIRTVADVERLQAEDPFRFQAWQVQQMKLQAAHAETERVNRERSQAQQSEWAQHVQKENELAAEYIPELADKVKGHALTQRVATELLPELGFKESELNDLASGKSKLSIYDHRVQRLLADAVKLRDIQKAPKAVAKPDLPPVVRPGASRPAGSTQSEQIKDLTRKLNETGDIKFAQQLRALQSRAS